MNVEIVITSCISMLMILAVVCSLFLIALTRNLSRYFHSMTSLKEQERLKLANETLIEAKKYDLESNDFTKHIENTVGVLNICRTLISIETNTLLDQYIKLNQKYEYLNIDKDSKEIAEKVFAALNKKMLQHNDEVGIISTDYILSFIASETILVLMESAQKINVQILME